MENKRYVTYEEFGAKGDGVTDDMSAIVRAHEFANDNGLPVKCKDGAVYYIGGKDITAVIKTDTDFGGSKFIIDDRVLENIKTWCFSVASDFEPFSPDIKSIAKGQCKVDFEHEGNVFVKIFSDKKKIFIRKGLNQNNGTDLTDSFVVNEKGEVTVGIDRDIPEITRVAAKRIDDKPITIKGGTFVTIANCWVSEYKYHCRGFNITRSSVTIEGVTHLIEGEGDNGAPYSGFFTVSDAVDVTIRSCTMTPHKTYYTASKLGPDKPVGMGTYDLSFGYSINTKLIGIRQTRDINDRTYWGLMGSNFCKNFYIDDCIISRFDAHMGVSGTTIKNSEFGHQCLSLIGYGDFYIENSTVNGYSFISLRPDYGSFWDGTITVKNCKWKPIVPERLVMINASNSGDHDFGYVCYMPREINIDGFEIDDSASPSETELYLLPNYDKDYAPGKPNKYMTVKKLSVSGIKMSKGREIKLTEHPKMYEDILFEKA